MYDCENSWVIEGEGGGEREGGKLTGQEVDVKEGERK